MLKAAEKCIEHAVSRSRQRPESGHRLCLAADLSWQSFERDRLFWFAGLEALVHAVHLVCTRERLASVNLRGPCRPDCCHESNHRNAWHAHRPRPLLEALRLGILGRRHQVTAQQNGCMSYLANSPYVDVLMERYSRGPKH